MRTHKAATIKHLFQAGYLVHHLLPNCHVAHLHAHFAHSPTSVAMFTSQLSGLPFSFTAHAKDIYTSDPRQLREKLGLAKFIVTCTEHNRHYLANLCEDRPIPIHRVYHGIDTDLFGGRSDCNSDPQTPFHVLTVARLIEKKGLPIVYKALKLLYDKGIRFQHTLIGDGSDRQQILALIQEIGLSSVTQWLGTLPHDRVLDYYRQADLFVLGCQVAADGDRDGIPNVFLESMAMGVPVVTTNISAIPELVENEKTGLLVPPGQPSQLADAMVRMLTDRDLRNHVIPAARQRVMQDFDNKVLIRHLADIFHKAGIGPEE